MKTILFCALFFVFYLFQTQTVFACSCAELSTTPADYVSGKFKSAEAVFSGKVISIEYRKMSEPEINAERNGNNSKFSEDDGNYERRIVKLRIYRWWKGFEQKQITLITDTFKVMFGGAEFGRTNSCEVGFEVEKEYLVFANGKDRKNLKAHACSGTTLLSNTLSYLKFLGEGRAPQN